MAFFIFLCIGLLFEGYHFKYDEIATFFGLSLFLAIFCFVYFVQHATVVPRDLCVTVKAPFNGSCP